MIRSRLTRAIIITASFVVAIYSVLFVLQGSMIFQGTQRPQSIYAHLLPYSHDLTVSSSITLQGWKVKGLEVFELATKPTVIIYFGGNAQDTASMAGWLAQLHGHYAYTYNYRGYGTSTGAPSEKHLYQDALFIYDHVQNLHPQSNITVMGHSMGSAMAGHVASQRAVHKLVLICPLHSIKRIAREQFYAPGWMIRHPFDLHHSASSITADTLVLISTGDTIIPNTHSMLTYEALRSNKALKQMQGVDHNTILSAPATINSINTFITETSE